MMFNRSIEKAILGIDAMLHTLDLRLDVCVFPYSDIIALIKHEDITYGIVRIARENPENFNRELTDVFAGEGESYMIQTKVEEEYNGLRINSYNPITSAQILKCIQDNYEWILRSEDGNLVEEKVSKVKRIGEYYETD